MPRMTDPRPALKRRIVLYDLRDEEREMLRSFADADRKTISRWVADAVRSEIKRRRKRAAEDFDKQ
jgi:hypothetical protein